MKKFLLGILIFTMAFNLVGGISSFAEEGRNAFNLVEGILSIVEEECNSFEGIKTAPEAPVSLKDKLSPICFDKFKKKIDYFSFLTTLDYTNMNMNQKKKIQENICQIEHEYWTACKGDISKFSIYTQIILKEMNILANKEYACPAEKPSFLEKIKSFFGLTNIIEL
ncbi:MAG: hypothetical protein RUMPE_00999 [Eubacteriales bacterium SKADARSKE-1]|nr:hypothetical protein [Eubacteriales bacterium SKADARSKE-1]